MRGKTERPTAIHHRDRWARHSISFVRSKPENALPLIVTHGWPGSIIEQPIIDPAPAPRHMAQAHRTLSMCCVDAGLRVFRQAGHDRLGPRAHGPSLGRTHEAPRLHRALRRPRAAIGVRLSSTRWACRHLRVARHPHQHACHRSSRRRPGAPARRPAAIRSLG